MVQIKDLPTGTLTTAARFPFDDNNGETKKNSVGNLLTLLAAAASSLEALSDTSIAGVTTDDIIRYGGSSWINTKELHNLEAVGIETSATTTHKLFVSGASRFSSIDVDGAANITGNAIVSGAGMFTGNINALGNVLVSGNVSVSGDHTVGGDINLTGNANITGEIIASATATFSQAVEILGTVKSYNMYDETVTRANFKDYSEETIITSASTSPFTINLTSANNFDVVLTTAVTFAFSNPPASGKTGLFLLTLRQDGTGSRTSTWPASVDWAGGVAPTLSTTAASVDKLAFETNDGGTTWYGVSVGVDFG